MVEIIHTRGDRHSHITLSSESLDILPEDVPDTEKLISQPRTLEHPKATLIHQATQFKIQLDQYDSPIHLGKPNRKVMPTINLETFKHAEVISRIHAAILIENDSFFIQDNGSANGTYLNRQRIQPGHPHPLISGDTISLGKGDLVTFTFELS